MNKLISVDFKADFGFLKKPDTNNPLYLTFNMLHKPALLGILGAILGLEGFKEPPKKKMGKTKKQKAQQGLLNLEEAQENPMPEYYRKLENIKIGIQPLGDEKGTFEKTVIQYNNGVGYANRDGNLIIAEQTLIAPAYRCFLLLDDTNTLHQRLIDYLKNSKAEYLPYLGKNDFSLWWERVEEHKYSNFSSTQPFQVNSIFLKRSIIKGNLYEDPLAPILGTKMGSFVFFENLPTHYNLSPIQYADYQPFTYTDFDLEQKYPLENLIKTNSDDIVQLF